MKYFCDLKNISSISNCENGRFVIKLLIGEKQNSYGKPYAIYGYTLMDKLGRVFENCFDQLDRGIILNSCVAIERDDGCYVGTKNNEKYLVDENLNVLAENIKTSYPFCEGVGLIEFKDGKLKWIDKSDGTLFDGGFKSIQDIKDDFAPVEGDDDLWFIADVKNDFKRCSDKYKYIVGTSSKYYIAQDEEGCVVLDLVGERFEKISNHFNTIFDVTDFGLVFEYDFDKKPNFKAYDLKGNLLFVADLIQQYDNQILNYRLNHRTFFFDQQKKQMIGSHDGYIYAEKFDGNKCPVCLGYDENDEGIYTILKDDGTSPKVTYEAIKMVDKDQAAAWLSDGTKSGGGKYYLIDDFGQPFGKGYRRLGRFNNGFATYEVNKDKYSYVSLNGTQFPLKFKSVSPFSENMAVTKSLEDKFEVYDTNAVSLTDVSGFVKKLENDPLEFLNMPQNFYGDKPLLDELYHFALNLIESCSANSAEEKQKLIHAKSSIKSKYEEAYSFKPGAKRMF